MNPEQPYNELPLLPPKKFIETPQILKMAISAHKELAELKGAASLIPTQSILIQTLALREAKLSSEIENIVTVNDELYRALSDDGEKTDANTKEVLRYNDALRFGYHAIQNQNRLLNTVLFEELAAIITQNSSGIRKLSGTQLKNPISNKTVYTPPSGEILIREKLSNLERFIYENQELDQLVKLAIIHYQFEAIHPFYDGNGRTGRIINILYLINERLLDFPILYLSKYIIENRADYYLGLLKVTAQEEWEPWILYILKGIVETAKMTKERIFAIKHLIDATVINVKKDLPKIYSKDLIEVLFKYPYCKIQFLEEAGLGSRQTASLYLQQLTEIGVLHCVKKGNKKYYTNKEFFEILTK